MELRPKRRIKKAKQVMEMTERVLFTISAIPEFYLLKSPVFPKTEWMSIIEYVKEPNACYAAMRIVCLELNEEKVSNKKKGKG